jgi:hypothetical protein
MNKSYPFTSTIILDDDTFVAYGGITGSTAPATREAAYFIAEKNVSYRIGTLLLPHNVTGTHYIAEIDPYLITDWGYINSLDRVSFINNEEEVYYEVEGTDNLYVSVRNRERGIVDIHRIYRQYCIGTSTYPYHIALEYNVGLYTGTATQPDFLLGLASYADMILNEIVGFGNEASGLVGLTNFRNQSYAESRVNLDRTDFGSSARAQFVKSTFNKYVKHKYIRW